MSEENQENTPTSAESIPGSGPTYRIITRYWPRIAVGLVALAAILEWVIGGLTSNGALEFYAFAWATTTGGLWFLFEKAEHALLESTRSKVVRWVETVDIKGSVGSIPSQFGLLFDRVFGDKHWTLSCFLRSCIASVSFVAVCFALLGPLGIGAEDGAEPNSAMQLAGSILFGALMFNVIPDFFSLLETRWLLGRVQQRMRVRWILVLDAVITLLIFLVTTLAVLLFLSLGVFKGAGVGGQSDAYMAGRFIGEMISNPTLALAIFASTFFTSVWLWLYAASVPISRVLVRMGGGVGFLLKITDVEKQPFRSMGFTSVVIVSLLFLVGLPFVLLS